MNALRSSPQPTSPTRVQRRRATRQATRPSRKPYRAIALEAGSKLAVNAVLAIVALVAIVRLVPYTLEQQSKVEDLEARVMDAEQRVQALRSEFNRNFDPLQASTVMQEQSNRIGPNQVRIIWTQPGATVSHTSTEDSIGQ
jgi:hypothetical protein